MTRILQFPSLGTLGRFGNWLGLYALARHYAERNDALLQTPDWCGQKIFQIESSPIEGEPTVTLRPPLPDTWDGIATLELEHGITEPKYSLEDFRRYFQFRPEMVYPHLPFDAAVHIRRGDFMQAPDLWPIVKIEAFIKGLILAKYIHGVNTPNAEFITEEEPHLWPDGPAEFPFLADFQIMVKAENLYVYPSSSFSSTAGMLNRNNVWLPENFTNGRTDCRWRLRP